MRQDIFQLRIHQSVDIDELKREVQIIGRILSQRKLSYRCVH
jgi:hypothetical protein